MQLWIFKSEFIKRDLWIFVEPWRSFNILIKHSTKPLWTYHDSKNHKGTNKGFFNSLYPRILLWKGKHVAVCEVPLQTETKRKNDVVAHTRRLSKEFTRKCKSSMGHTFSRNAVQEVVQQTGKPYTTALLLEL